MESKAVRAAVARVRHLDHLNLTVKNLHKSLEFYQELFGFELVETGAPDPVSWAIVKSGEAVLCLYEHADVPEGPHYPERPEEQGMRHFALRIENGAEFHELLKTLNIPLHHGGPVRWPHSTSYYLSDPSGHHIEAVAWNEERIAFDPLDRTSEFLDREDDETRRIFRSLG